MSKANFLSYLIKAETTFKVKRQKNWNVLQLHNNAFEDDNRHTVGFNKQITTFTNTTNDDACNKAKKKATRWKFLLKSMVS